MWATASFWDTYSGLFTGRGYSTTAINLLYHGDSKDKLNDIHVMDYVRQVEAELSNMKEKSIIIGHSMGALIAQKLAVLGHAAGLVLLAPLAPMRISIPSYTILRTFSANICDILLKRPFIIPQGNAAYGLTNTMSREAQTAFYQGLVHESGLAAYEIASGKVSIDHTRVNCPVLVIAGEHDRVTPPSMVRKISYAYGADYKEYPHHCHVSLVNGHGWEKIATDIVDWLWEQEKRQRL